MTPPRPAPGLPAWPPRCGDAPGTRLARVPGIRRAAGKEGEAQRRPPLLRCEPPSRAEALRSPLRRRSGRAPPPGSHFGSGGPVAITAQQLTRRRSGAGSSGGVRGARQGGSSPRRERAGDTRQSSRELSGDGSTGMQPWVRAMLSVAKR